MTLAWAAAGAVLGDVDVALARVLERRWPGAAPAALRAAALASWCVQQGHTCLDFDALAHDGVLQAQLAEDPRLAGVDAAELRAAAARSPFVRSAGDAAALQPLVLDGGRLYLARYHAYEHEVAAALRSRAATGDAPRDPKSLRAALDVVFPGLPPVAAVTPADLGDAQVEASIRALYQRLSVLCGGPGTGKTWTIVRLLALLAALDPEPALRVGLAAPTGKAATRLTASLREGVARLDLAPALRARLQLEATTIHRLLGLGAMRVRPRHDTEHPLPLDLLIVDESSMVDLPLFAKLLRALPPACRLVLVGDPGQLPAVEGGAVFGALSGSGRAPARDVVVRLTRARRFGAGSVIARLVEAVHEGDAGAVRALLAQGDPALRWHDAVLSAQRESFEAAVRDGYRALRAARAAGPALAALDRFRVLCALREGPLGVDGLNLAIESALGVRRPEHGNYRGRPVLVSANDYQLGLYNGDAGVLLGGGTARGVALGAWFAGADGTVRAIPTGQLPAHETGYAMTVHKAQGSEFDDVLLALPRTPHALISREWLYTAVSRARQRLTIFAPWDVIAAALARPHLLMSGLADRL